MADKTIKRRVRALADAALASVTAVSTIAKLVGALERCIPEGTQNAECKKGALLLGRELLRAGRNTRASEELKFA